MIFLYVEHVLPLIWKLLISNVLIKFGLPLFHYRLAAGALSSCLAILPTIPSMLL